MPAFLAMSPNVLFE